MTDRPDRRIGAAIARLREERGWSQRSLAKVVGLDQSALSRVEAGKRRLAAGELDVIARALGVSPAALLAGPGGSGPAAAAPSLQMLRASFDDPELAESDRESWLEGSSAEPSLHAPADAESAAPRSSDGPGDPRHGRRRVDTVALGAAIDEADAVFQRLQAERAGAAGRDRRADAVPGAGTHVAAQRPGPESFELRRGLSAAAFPATPALPPRDALLPDMVEDVLADWFALRAAASSPRDWEHPGGRAVRASGKPLHQPSASSPGPAAAPGVPPGAPVSPFVGQPWSWGAPRDRIARFWRQELHIDPDGPVPDLIPLLEDVAGIDVIVARLSRDTPVCACAVRDGAAFVFVNAARPVVLQRYALAHALGHLALGHGGVVDERIDWGRGNAREGETNDFSEEFLVPVAAVARWYDRHGDPTPDVEAIVELANAFGVSFWAAMYRSRAARRLNPKRQAALTAELRRLEWQLLPRQAFLGGLKDTLTALTPADVCPPGEFGPPAVLRVPARMRAWALRAVAAGGLSLEGAAAALRMPAHELASELARAGLE